MEYWIQEIFGNGMMGWKTGKIDLIIPIIQRNYINPDKRLNSQVDFPNHFVTNGSKICKLNSSNDDRNYWWNKDLRLRNELSVIAFLYKSGLL